MTTAKDFWLNVTYSGREFETVIRAERSC
jgi:hypothetical protein